MGKEREVEVSQPKNWEDLARPWMQGKGSGANYDTEYVSRTVVLSVVAASSSESKKESSP